MSVRAMRPIAAAVLALLALLGAAGEGAAQKPAPPAAREGGEMEMEVPHGVFTHEGLSEAVGNFSLRTAALATRVNGKSQGDFAFHFETRLTKTIGLHMRNDRFLNSR